VLLTLDYPDDEVRVGKGRLPEPDGREVFRLRGAQRPHLRIEVGGHRETILLDSGAGAAFVLNPSETLDWASAPRPLGATMKINRIELRFAGRLVNPVRFGPAVVERPVAELGEGTVLVGERILRHFELTFDQRQRRVRMKRSDASPIVTAPLRGIGAGLRPTVDGMRVLRVFAGTPAEEAGLRENDLVTAVDDGADRTTLTVIRDGRPLSFDLAVIDLVP
jgi:hypothetical protein